MVGLAVAAGGQLDGSGERERFWRLTLWPCQTTSVYIVSRRTNPTFSLVSDGAFRDLVCLGGSVWTCCFGNPYTVCDSGPHQEIVSSSQIASITGGEGYDNLHEGFWRQPESIVCTRRESASYRGTLNFVFVWSGFPNLGLDDIASLEAGRICSVPR
jgi:hypothetical protein